MMTLTITTPQVVLLDLDDVASVQAEDASGCFAIWPGHVDFLTVLAPSVLTYSRHGQVRHVATRGGLFAVRGGGRVVEVATRQAFAGDDLDQLEAVLLGAISQAEEDERVSRRHAAHLHATVARMVRRYLRSGRDNEAHHPAGAER